MSQATAGADTNLELELVAASYRFVSDDSAFHDCLEAWARKLEKLPMGLQARRNEEDSLFRGHLRGLRELVERVVKPSSVSPIEEAVSEINAPAMVITTRGAVVTMNAKAHRRFSALQGQKNSFEWLDPISQPDFDDVLASANRPDNWRHAIVRTIDEDETRGLAEVFVVKGAADMPRFVAIRAMETFWSERVDLILEQAFGLTRAERDVVKLLYERCEVSKVAKLRGTTMHTARTQLRTIMDKTDTSSQVDLMRLLGLLAARASHGSRGEQDKWRDPWGNQQVLVRPNGRAIAYSWTGAEDGTPALLVHGAVQGYFLGPDIEQRLVRENIKLYAIVRPGFGPSASDPDCDFMQDQVEAIDWLLDHLDLGRVPAIGLGNGSIPLLQLAARRPEAFSGLLVMGLLFPMGTAQLSRLSPVQRALANFVHRAPRVAEIFADVSDHYIRQKGVDWYLKRGWGDVPEVQATLADPDSVPLIRNACELTISISTFDFVREMQCQWKLDPACYNKIACSVHHIHGQYDRSVSKEEANFFASLSPQFSTECIQGAGYFLPYEKPGLFADRLIEAVSRRHPQRLP